MLEPPTPRRSFAAVRAHQADYGVALDGDADRLVMVDATGRLFNGDELLYLLARGAHGRDQLVPGVVGTLMTNMAIERALRAQGVKMERAESSGDRYVPGGAGAPWLGAGG